MQCIIAVSCPYCGLLLADSLNETIKVFLVLLYRLTLHPLAKYPGPVWGKVTDLYVVWHIWNGDRHLDLYELHDRYGVVAPST